MRRHVSLSGVLLAVTLAGPFPAAATVPPLQVTLSSHRAGARPVLVRLQLRYPMQCAWPGVGPVVIRFPAGTAVPASLPRGSVLVDGRPRNAHVVRADEVAVALPPRPQILCDAITQGTLTVTFSRAARLGNPARPGTYALRATKGALRFAARVTIGRR